MDGPGLDIGIRSRSDVLMGPSWGRSINEARAQNRLDEGWGISSGDTDQYEYVETAPIGAAAAGVPEGWGCSKPCALTR